MNRLNIYICVFLGVVCIFLYRKTQVPYFYVSTPIPHFYVSNGYQSPDAYIAHGGGIGEFEYTNCLEGVLDSLKKGFRFIEIDMLETSDGYILGAHDWKYFRSLVEYKDDSGSPLSYDEVKNLNIKGEYSILTGNNIYNLMKEFPQFTLVTDKIKNYRLLLEEIPLPDRIIVEVFNIDDYKYALKEGIKYPAFHIGNEDAFNIAIEHKIPIVTMKASKFLKNKKTRSMVQKLHDGGVAILSSGNEQDNPEYLKKYLGKSISKIYTNKYSPTSLPD